jgi:dephospho-CoA kinase
MKIFRDQTTGPVKLGITGGVGSGKSFACNYLKEKGMRVVSADELARNAVLPGTPAYLKIVDYFGVDILCPDKTLDRSRLRDIITRDPEKKQMLEQFVHPEVFAQMAAEYQKSVDRQDPVIAVEVPLLFETGMEGFFDYVLTISVQPECRIARLMARDGISRDQAAALMKIQMPESEKIEKSDFVIDNNGAAHETKKRIDEFYENFKNRIKSEKN